MCLDNCEFALYQYFCGRNILYEVYISILLYNLNLLSYVIDHIFLYFQVTRVCIHMHYMQRIINKLLWVSLAFPLWIGLVTVPQGSE